MVSKIQCCACGRSPLNPTSSSPSASRLPDRRRIVVIPTSNEADSLPVIVDQVLRALPIDILIVDDASPDGTGDIADTLATADPRVSVIHRPGKAGLGPAYVQGFHAALDRGYEHIFQMDADGSHAPSAGRCLRRRSSTPTSSSVRGTCRGAPSRTSRRSGRRSAAADRCTAA